MITNECAKKAAQKAACARQAAACNAPAKAPPAPPAPPATETQVQKTQQFMNSISQNSRETIAKAMANALNADKQSASAANAALNSAIDAATSK